MKKASLAAVALIATFMLSSCYSSSVSVGSIKKSDDLEHVATVHNSHFLYGLIGKKQVKAERYVDGPNYLIKRHQSFVDGLLSCITFGIYTPTTTKFYEPEGD